MSKPYHTRVNILLLLLSSLATAELVIADRPPVLAGAGDLALRGLDADLAGDADFSTAALVGVLERPRRVSAGEVAIVDFMIARRPVVEIYQTSSSLCWCFEIAIVVRLSHLACLMMRLTIPSIISVATCCRTSMTVVVIVGTSSCPLALPHAQGVCLTLLVLAQDLDDMNEHHHALGQ
jgi:hypothetical protein